MRSPQELDLLRERAIALRREGKSRRQIKEILGPMSNSTLDDGLRGVPPPEWTLRPNAKDDLRAKARDLRTQGLDYEEIAAALGAARARFPSGRPGPHPLLPESPEGDWDPTH